MLGIRAVFLVIAMFAGGGAALAAVRQDCRNKRGDEAIRACTEAIRANPGTCPKGFIEYKGAVAELKRSEG
jgi:hypothetical protein